MIKIEEIAHLSDVHLRKIPRRNAEYEFVFNNLYESLRKRKPQRIAIVGDLVHDYLDLQGEQLILASHFLNELSKIAPVRITRGNHDCRKKNLKRVDSVRALVETLHNEDVVYYDNVGFYEDENITWAVWHHGERNNNPWKLREGKKHLKTMGTSNNTYIDLFHDSVSGSKLVSGIETKGTEYYKVSDFKGDLSFFGHLHLAQFLNKAKTKAYCGSLIAQDFSEGDDNFHGYFMWNLSSKIATRVPVVNDHSFKNIKLSTYIDFDDLDFEIENPTKHMNVRFIWNTLPSTRTTENERKLISYVKSLHENTVFTHKNDFVEVDEIVIDKSVNLVNINENKVQHIIFKEYLDKIGVKDSVIEEVINLDIDVTQNLEIDVDGNVEWDIIKFGGVNFMSYGDIDVDWRDKEGLFQITGINTAGKTTINKLLSYVLYGKTLETESRMKFGDKRFVNNRNDAESTDCYVVLHANGVYYGVKRKTIINRSKTGEINGAPTVLSYYILSNPDEEMSSDNSLEILDEDRKATTQKTIAEIIGTYENFKRITMTTSDTLNTILSNDMATFIDSLLFDSGLDIFDKKLAEFKLHQKRVNSKSRVTCNVELTTQENARLTAEEEILDAEILNIETVEVPSVVDRIVKGKGCLVFYISSIKTSFICKGSSIGNAIISS
jgi:hypothetical protein